MKRINVIDPYFENQPPLKFIDDLKKEYHTTKPLNFGKRACENDEVCIAGLYLKQEFVDDKIDIGVIREDFNKFISLCSIDGDKYCVRLIEKEVCGYESYEIKVDINQCVICANDNAGFIRALVEIEDEMIRREGPYIQKGTRQRKPILTDRITRGFFSPTNRPPKNGDELLDDVDYYPDEYLNRLMHDGTNGLWIYSSFRQLVKSPVMEEYGENGEKRIEKLNSVIKKCKRYGIKVFLFAIEPIGFDEQQARKYPHMVGQDMGELASGQYKYTMCTHTPEAVEHIEYCGEELFRLCPDLEGLISITAGERVSSCVTPDICTCERCKSTKRGELLSEVVEILKNGIRRSKPDAKVISWTYGHRIWNDEDIKDYVKTAPSDAVLLQNFEDRGFEMQLGKERIAMDYWLSYIGPSQLFDITAKQAMESKKTMYAKMQICASHEVATVPYVPVPLNVYQKVKKAIELNVTGIMQCWYFGNYPCFMSKAVGMLAFKNDFKSDDEFLRYLAMTVFGKSRAENIYMAWKHFSQGYVNFPINIMFSYYSPMQDGVAWELSLMPKNFSLPRTWQLVDKPDGDRICECLLTSHTLEEAIELISGMKKEYLAAMEYIKKIPMPYTPNEIDLNNVCEALCVLCESCHNILTFYHLRDKLGKNIDAKSTLKKLENIVFDEILLSEKMICVCEKDNRIGYHSEAEGYKFFPEKLNSRIKTLKNLLKTEFAEVHKRIESGLAPLEYYEGIEPDCQKRYLINSEDINDASWEYLKDNKTKFRMSDNGNAIELELRSEFTGRILVSPEFNLFQINAPFYVYPKNQTDEPRLVFAGTEHWPYYGDRIESETSKWNTKALEMENNMYGVKITFKKSDFNITEKRAFKLEIISSNNISWEEEVFEVRTLGKEKISPGCYGWVVYE